MSSASRERRRRRIISRSLGILQRYDHNGHIAIKCTACQLLTVGNGRASIGAPCDRKECHGFWHVSEPDFLVVTAAERLGGSGAAWDLIEDLNRERGHTEQGWAHRPLRARPTYLGRSQGSCVLVRLCAQQEAMITIRMVYLCCDKAHVTEESARWFAACTSAQCGRGIEEIYMGHGGVDVIPCNKPLHQLTEVQVAAYLIGGEEAVKVLL